MEASPELRTIFANGLELAVWDWPGSSPPLVFAHATAFHGRCWDRIIHMFPGRRSVAVDSRGHGRSSKPEPPYHWRTFGRDLAAVAKHMNLRDAIGVGHSMGGHTVIQAAALTPETFSALLLLDPTIFPPQYYGTEPLDSSFTLRRRATWSSPDEMFERFRHRVPFARWQPEILRDYCEFGLLPNGQEFVLACSPAAEASIYMHSKVSEANLYKEIAKIAQPVVVLRAGTPRTPGIFDLSGSPTAADLASKFPRGRDVLLPDSSHYIPMENPELVADEIKRLTR